MKIAFNPSTVAALIAPPNNKDITFDLRGQNIFARGVKFCGTDTNTWRDIKINNVSIGSNTLDLRDGDNTTLTNINGVVTINSTWRPVVDNLTSDSTTSSLSANQGRVLKALIDGKSDSDHNHDDRYLRLTGGQMLGDITFGGDNKICWGRNTDSASISFKNDGDGDTDSYMSFVTSDNGNEYFRWSHSSGSTNTEWMALRSDGLRVGGTKVSLEGHSHNDLYYTKTEVNNKLNGKSDTGHTHDDRYLKLTGGTMNGTIYRNSGGTTISGRDHAIIRQTYAPGGSSWNPIACVDTETGTWTLGHLSSGDSDTNFHFCFSTNTDYNAGNNNGNYVTLRNKVGTIALLSEIPDKNSWNYDDRYVKKSGDTMLGALNFANGTWNLVGDDSYMGDCNVSGHFGIKAANTTYPGIAFFNNANAHLGNLTAYSGNIKYGAYSLQFLDNGNTSVSASTWTNPFSDYNSNAVADGQAICVWGQSSSLSNLAADSGDMSLWLKRVNANVATLNMVLDGEYYANGIQRLAHVSEIPTSLKNPYALTISLNGTSQGPYDGSAAKNINITPSSIGAATSDHNHDSSYVKYAKVTKSTSDSANANPYIYNIENEAVISGYYNYWYILNFGQYSGGNFGTQIAMPYQDSLTDSELFIRSAKSGSWRTWRRILHSNNYASILDSRYYTESEINTKLGAYLPLTGGTLTGDLYINTNLYGPARGSNPRNQYDAGLYFFNCDSSTTSTYNFGLYQWKDEFQFTYRTSANNLWNGNSFTIQGSDGQVTFAKIPKVGSTLISLNDHTHAYLPLSGGTLTGTLGKSNNYIFKPNGGDFRTNTEVYTGAICISLPANIGNTMLSMWIDVYNYSYNKSFSVHVGGYTYTNSTFQHNPFAMVYGALHKVRLTYNNGFKIYIGEINTTWYYPQISIRDVVLGFGQNYSNWYNDWSVSFVTSFPSINTEITRYTITTDNISSQSVNYASSAGNADTVDGIDSTGFLRYYNSNSAPSNVDIVNTTSYVWTVSTTGGSVANATKPSGVDNAWGVIHLHTHIGNYATQLGFGGTTNRMYMRNAYNTSTFGNWQALAFITDIPTSLPANGGNADTVDGYHASSLWRSDGGIWNPSANISLTASGNNQEWSFDIGRNGHTGCFWQVWDNNLYTLLKVSADNGKVYAPYNFVGNLEGNASTATALTTNAGNSINPVYFSGGKPVACTMSTGRGDGIVRSFSRGAYTSANQYFGNGTIVAIDPIGTGCISANDTILSLGDLANRNTQLLVAWDRDGVYYRRITDSQNYGNWKRLAFTTDNIDSATKLATARNIWGQSFNGTADVNGTIYINNSDSSNGAIRLNNDRNSNARISAISDQVIFNTGSAIRFGETAWDWNQWAGLKYTHSNKTIYLGIADNSIFNANSAQSGGTLNLRAGISNIDLNSGTSIRGLPTNGSPYSSRVTLNDTSIYLSSYGDISMSTGPGAIELSSGYGGIKLSCQGNNASIDSGGFKVEASRGAYLNSGNSGNVYLCQGGGNVSIGYSSPSYKLDVNGQMRASGFHHSSVNSDNYMLLAGGGYKSFGGDYNNPIFLGYLNLERGYDGTISSSFYCLGYSVSFTYTRGGNYCKISIPDTSYQTFYIRAATASVNYSGGGMDTWTGYRRGDGAWWLHCYAYSSNEVRVKGFRQANDSNDSWWGGNPLVPDNGGANRITVCIFGYVTFR